MFAQRKHLFLVLLAVLLVCGASATAMAQCATCGAQAVAYQPATYQAAYAPVAYQAAYAPVTYTTAYSGWYPGYWLGRANRTVWGVPTYSVGYAPATTYAASYAPAYTVGYAPVSSCPTCSTCSTCSASYAPTCSTCSASYAPTCSTCTANYAPTCSTCGTVSEVVLRPVCDSCSGSSTCSSCQSCSGGSPCSGCSTCGAAPTVTQAVYEQPSGCSSCGAGQPAPVAAPAPALAPTTYTNPAPSTYRAAEPQPTLAPTPQTAPPSTFRETQKVEPGPAMDSAPILQPTPQKGPGEASSTNLEAPRLLSPQDRTAQHNAAPVWMAVYNKPASGRTAVHTVSREQAMDDASGWVSASK
jgi:hypothetical protein